MFDLCQAAALDMKPGSAMINTTLLGWPRQPVEVAPAYVLLASDEGRDMTGALLPVTGGMPML